MWSLPAELAAFRQYKRLPNIFADDCASEQRVLDSSQSADAQRAIAASQQPRALCLGNNYLIFNDRDLAKVFIAIMMSFYHFYFPVN